MPKIEEFCHIYNKRMERHAAHTLRCASETITLGILDHFKF
jgi:hypothetical protein